MHSIDGCSWLFLVVSLSPCLYVPVFVCLWFCLSVCLSSVYEIHFACCRDFKQPREQTKSFSSTPSPFLLLHLIVVVPLLWFSSSSLSSLSSSPSCLDVGSMAKAIIIDVFARTERQRLPPGPTGGGNSGGRPLSAGTAMVRRRHRECHRPRQLAQEGVWVQRPRREAHLFGMQASLRGFGEEALSGTFYGHAWG